MTAPPSIRKFTPAEYYSLERDAEYKSDYYQGEIFATAGGTIRHSAICTNLSGELRSRLKGTPCRAYESNLRLKVAATGLRTYPDVSVYCGPLEPDPEDPAGETLTNPTVLCEVLSPSTEAYDRGLKAGNYRRISSLEAYVLVAQDSVSIELHERQPNGDWLLHDVRGLDQSLKITAINITLPLSEIYDGVDFAEWRSA